MSCTNPEELTCDAARDLAASLEEQGMRSALRTLDAASEARSLVAYTLLRLGLGYLGPADHSCWRLVRAHGGQPRLHHTSGAPSGLHCSISHTRALAVCGVGRAARVGVDAEWTGGELDSEGLAEVVLSPEEYRVWAGMGREAGRVRLYEFWTLKEALLKATGWGLRVDPSRIGFDLSDASHPVLVHAPLELHPHNKWSFVIDRSESHVSAVALEGPPPAPGEMTRFNLDLPGLLQLVEANRNGLPNSHEGRVDG